MHDLRTFKAIHDSFPEYSTLSIPNREIGNENCERPGITILNLIFCFGRIKAIHKSSKSDSKVKADGQHCD